MAVAESIGKKTRQRPVYQVGTMIEIPRACLIADQIAAEAEFFSFGTNDLTQLTYGYSRDDVAKFLPEYLATPDAAGGSVPDGGRRRRGPVGHAWRSRVDARPNPGLKVGVCGEHGGDPGLGALFPRGEAMDYVSCSPYRVPVARLAAAQAVLSSSDRREVPHRFAAFPENHPSRCGKFLTLSQCSFIVIPDFLRAGPRPEEE